MSAGGEPTQLKSAGLLVAYEQSFPLVDLRVDFDPQPLVQLRFLWEVNQPMVDYFHTRSTDPDNVAPIG